LVLSGRPEAGKSLISLSSYQLNSMKDENKRVR
jgi:hypothetical protein